MDLGWRLGFRSWNWRIRWRGVDLPSAYLLPFKIAPKDINICNDALYIFMRYTVMCICLNIKPFILLHNSDSFYSHQLKSPVSEKTYHSLCKLHPKFSTNQLNLALLDQSPGINLKDKQFGIKKNTRDQLDDLK